MIDNVRIGMSRDFRINQVTALANLEADADSSLSSLEDQEEIIVTTADSEVINSQSSQTA